MIFENFPNWLDRNYEPTLGSIVATGAIWAATRGSRVVKMEAVPSVSATAPPVNSDLSVIVNINGDTHS